MTKTGGQTDPPQQEVVMQRDCGGPAYKMRKFLESFNHADLGRVENFSTGKRIVDKTCKGVICLAVLCKK